MNKISKATVRPTRSLNLLSHREVLGVMEADKTVFKTFRDCALAVLNSGSEQDDVEALMKEYSDFEVKVISESRGLKLEVRNAPACAFVDGKMIRGIQDHLFAVLRDVVYTEQKMHADSGFDINSSAGLTDAVFRILRNAGVVQANRKPNLVVCWGGHSIDRLEYDFSKEVGYHLGLRGLDIATGCGIGAMKGPMKGALIGHSKQQNKEGRYVGITEPGIIASESPNPTVSELVILPDIEKRLEAFVRLAHAIVVFPGGAGTAEEVLYLIGALMHPQNNGSPLPVIFAAPHGREEYFATLDKFIRNTLGDDAAAYYKIVNGNAEQAARAVLNGIDDVVRYRRRTQESYAFNWNLTIPEEFQQPFLPTHENMEALQLSKDLPDHELAAQLRKAFSGIVAGNVKAYGIQQIKQHGPYRLKADPVVMEELEILLAGFVKQGRMKLKETNYKPCYELIK